MALPALISRMWYRKLDIHKKDDLLKLVQSWDTDKTKYCG